MAWQGKVQGAAKLGKAGQGLARQGLARQGKVRGVVLSFKKIKTS
jgi:hypothetical protein